MRGRSGGSGPRPEAEERLIVALDLPDLQPALGMARQLFPLVRWFKVGLELYSAAGPEVIRVLKGMGAKVFVDLKLHDIPHTVGRAAAVLAREGADMFTVHAAGGSAMLAEALAAAASAPAVGGVAAGGAAGSAGARVLAVTVLTSLGSEDLREQGIRRSVQGQVVSLARCALRAGVQGLVASPQEAARLRRLLGWDWLLVTPGIRPAAGAGAGDDQKRVATPGAAVAAGADYLVVGRPITRADNPRQAAAYVLAQMQEASERFDWQNGCREVYRI